MDAGSIKPIDKTSVHKICSGQVVLTLATAVKELVENSLDAGATSIEVKLKDYGSKVIEVIDNGKGVKECDFQNLTLKYHTSKIADFSDLPFVSTFGFRGEALSSLCALSDLEVTTCHTSSSVGTILTFDSKGTLVKTTPTPRQTGTTVTLKNLFHTFPVRHKEFLKNLRREFAKMVQLLTAYCLISVGKRITCCNVTEKGKKNVVLSTNGCSTYKDNILSLFGDKQWNQLLEIKQHSPSKEVLEEFFLSETAIESSQIFKLEGFISSSTHGEGRSSTDRQFYFITGRPCNFNKVSKLINEVYHSFNKNQYPFVFLNVSLNEGYADVNVTPDKREIFVPNEKVLLALVKTTLLGMYSKQPSQLSINQLNNFFIPTADSKKTENSSQEICSHDSVKPDSGLKRKFNVDVSLSDEEIDCSPRLFKSKKLDTSLTEDSGFERSSQDSPISKNTENSRESPILSITDTSKTNAQLSKLAQEQRSSPSSFTKIVSSTENNLVQNSSLGASRLKSILDSAVRGNAFRQSNVSMSSRSFQPQKKQKSKLLEQFSFSRCSKQSLNDSSDAIDLQQQSDVDVSESFLPDETPNSPIQDENQDETALEDFDDADDIGVGEVEVVVDERLSVERNYQSLEFKMEWLKKKRRFRSDDPANILETCGYRKFRSKIAPTENQTAEDELKKEIRKDDFAEMEVIGQFNLGFIIARLRNDLFIIDQHATDEKYNFERLQKDTTLETQKLLQPQNLNLTAISEAILLDNLTVFEVNGFKFSIEEEKPCGEKVQLVSVPVSRNWDFGKEDIDELIFMLTDNPGRMVRPSRVNQMFASRACRKSVMIGTALTHPMMKKLVCHMGEIEQPWNCPHGRPTMRHLFNLNILKTS